MPRTDRLARHAVVLVFLGTRSGGASLMTAACGTTSDAAPEDTPFKEVSRETRRVGAVDR